MNHNLKSWTKFRSTGEGQFNLKFRMVNFILFFFVITSCQNAESNRSTEKKAKATNPIAALFSKTTIAAEKEYRNIDGVSLRCDVFVPSRRLGEPPWVEQRQGRKPTLLYFHGGGWRGGEKESRILEVLPYVQKGWVVVTANYRLLHQASLPEIVGDCRTALNWIFDNANKYKIDTTKIVLAGNSAGGHLALMTALAKDDSKYTCGPFPNNRILKVAAVVNWYGITDVSKFVDDWKDKHILIEDTSKLDQMYAITSPINFVDREIPPILSVHGEIDKIVTIEHAETLHQLLQNQDLKNKLLKIENRKHGNFDAQEMTEIYQDIWKFLDDIKILSSKGNY